MRRGAGASVSGRLCHKWSTLSPCVSPSARPLQHPFILLGPIYLGKLRHRSHWLAGGPREMGWGGDSLRAIAVFATKVAFNHTRLISGQARASPWRRRGPAALLPLLRHWRRMDQVRCALQVPLSPISGEAKLKRGQNLHRTTQRCKKRRIVLFFCLLLWEPWSFGRRESKRSRKLSHTADSLSGS